MKRLCYEIVDLKQHYRRTLNYGLLGSLVLILGTVGFGFTELSTDFPLVLIALGTTIIMGLLGFAVLEKIDVVVIILMFSLLWFAIFELLLWTKFAWVKSQFGLLVRVQGIGVAVFLAPLAAISLLQIIIKGTVQTPYLLDFVLAARVFLGVITMLIGILRGNAIGYVFGDTYKFLLMPLVYLVCVRLIQIPQQRWSLWILMALSGLLLNFGGLVSQLHKFAIDWPYKLGRTIDLLTFSVSIILYGLARRKIVKRATFVAILIMVLSAALSLERRNWLFVALTYGMVVIFARGKIQTRLILFALMGSIVLLGCLLLLNWAFPVVISQTRTGLEQRLDYTFVNQGPDPSVTRRLDEMKYIKQEFQDASPIYWLIGFGQGAEFYDPWSEKPGSRPNLVHNIHNTFVTVIFRTGLIGLLIMVGFIVLSLKMAYDCTRFAYKRQELLDLIFSLAAFVFLLVWFLVGWNIFPSIGDVRPAFVIGLLASTRRWQKDTVSQ